MTLSSGHYGEQSTKTKRGRSTGEREEEGRRRSRSGTLTAQHAAITGHRPGVSIQPLHPNGEGKVRRQRFVGKHNPQRRARSQTNPDPRWSTGCPCWEPSRCLHGDVMVPDFSDFLLLDKAAACFRSSRFLACSCSVTSLWVFSIWFILARV